MDQRSEFLIQVLEKIGTPLMEAISEVSAKQDSGGEEDAALQDAGRMAELLAKSVEVSVSLAQTMDLKEHEEGELDSVRLALAALAGPLVAHDYKVHGRVPGENEIKRMTKALEAVMTFSDNFTPSAAHAQRLKALESKELLFDDHQSHMAFISALVPVVSAIAEFPFGQNEAKLIQDVTANLMKRTEILRESLFGAEKDKAEVKFQELMLLHALARIYTESHQAETKRLLSMDEEERSAKLSIDPVWEAFDLRVSMLETVLGIAVPGAPEQPPETDQTAPEPVPETAPPPEAETSPPAQEPASTAVDSGNPMGFFKSKGEDEQTSPPAAPDQQTPEQPAVQQDTPPSPPPSAESPKVSSEEAKGNPMAFFKPGAKKEESEEPKE